MKKIILFAIIIYSISIKISFAQCFTALDYTFSSDTVTFIDTSGTAWLNYSWDFGDGLTDTQASPTHIYTTSGIYVACLTASDANGCVATGCLNVGVNSPVTNTVLYVNPLYQYNCTAPLFVPFMFYITPRNFPNPDSVFKCTVNFGDGIDSTFYISFYGGTYQTSLYHTYTNPGTYTIHATDTSMYLVSSSASSPAIVVAASCGSVSGTVYNDLNHNCIYDTGEEIGGVPLLIYDASLQPVGWTTTDSSGLYSFNVPTANLYEIHVDASNAIISHFAPTCPSTGIIQAAAPSSGNNIGVECPTAFDLQGYVTVWNFRPGFTAEVCISAYNQWCHTPAGQIQVVMDPRLTPLPDTNGTGYTVNGNTVTFPISPGEYYWSFCIPAEVATNAQIGDSACIDLDIQPVAGDSIPSNNTGHSCFAIVGSYDPNDKTVSPAGDGAQGFILPNTPLTYTIRFQNTGSADAVNIYILDTLDANLDATSVEVIGSSYAMSWSLLTGNILRFNFNNIHLPDSNSNEPASHGYVSYRINQKSNISDQAQINNTAAIFFDFNSPVLTNTATNTIDYFLSVPIIKNSTVIVTAYPNPSDRNCQLSFKSKEARTISISEKSGKEVARFNSYSDILVFDTSKYTNGVYSVSVVDKNKKSETIQLVVQH